MANVLADLFQDIADAIRSKTGSAAKMAPASFPEKITEINTSADSDYSVIYDTIDGINGEVIGETLYTVTFVGAEGTQLGQMYVYDGNDCEDPVSSGVFGTPTKESTRYYGWTFSGWSRISGGSASSEALKNVSGDLTLYAAFTQYEILVASGYCGGKAAGVTGIHWSIDPDYVLRLVKKSGGSSSVGNYYDGAPDGSTPPWHDYQAQITAITVGTGITGIGMYCFDGCTALTDVEFPSTLRTIANRSFRGCTGLTSVEIPAAVKYIYEEAFSGCVSLESATFERVSGWAIYDGSAVVASLTQADVANPAVAASYLINADGNHLGDWKNADAA